MTRFSLPWAVALMLFPLAVGAAEPVPAGPAPAGPAAEAAAALLKPDQIVPKRQLVFDQTEEEVPIYLSADLGSRVAEVVEQRYVAVLSMRFRFPDVPAFSSYSELRQRSAYSVRHSYSLAEAAANAPRDRLPPGDLTAMLTTDSELHVRTSPREVELGSSGASGSSPPGQPGRPDQRVAVAHEIVLHLIAPTPERAKELAQAALVLLDWGQSLPSYRNYVELQGFYESKASELRAQRKNVEEEQSARQKEFDQLKPWSDITQNSLANLTAQRRMIAVEETGIKARIAECDRLLKESKDLTAVQVGQVETVKIAAKIELVGLAAKRAAIEELVEKGNKWLGLTGQRMRFDASRGYQTSLLQEAETRAAAYKAAVEKKLPFAEVEGKVRIRRVRWDQPKPGAKTEPASSPPRAKRGSAPGR